MTAVKRPNVFIRILLMIGYLLMVILANNLGLLSLVVSGFTVVSPMMDIIITITGIILALAICYFLYTKYRKWSGQTNYRVNLKDIAIGIGYTLLLRIVIILIALLMVYLFGDTSTANDDIIMGAFEGSNLPMIIALVVTTVIVAPLSEEFVFRGLMTHLLFANKYRWLTAVLASLIFSTFHISTNFVSFFLYFAIGFIIHVAYYRRMNIMDAVLVHAFNNAIATFGMLILAFG